MGAGGHTPTAQAPFDEVLTGVETVGTSVTRLTSRPFTMVRFKAASANAASIFVAAATESATLTVANGFEIEPGDDTGWIPIDNLNLLEAISASSNQKLQYMAVK